MLPACVVRIRSVLLCIKRLPCIGGASAGGRSFAASRVAETLTDRSLRFHRESPRGRVVSRYRLIRALGSWRETGISKNGSSKLQNAVFERKPSYRDRWFESVSLQRRVHCA